MDQQHSCCSFIANFLIYPYVWLYIYFTVGEDWLPTDRLWNEFTSITPTFRSK